MTYQGSDWDAYREAWDIHGEDVKCCRCGVTMDSLTVDHYDYTPHVLSDNEVQEFAEQMADWVKANPEVVSDEVVAHVKRKLEAWAAEPRPLCDRCYWQDWYNTHDPDTGEPLAPIEDDPNYEED